jgi:hypothetical protein
MDEFSRRAMFDVEASSLLTTVREHFQKINKDSGLTPEDKRQLKAYYLQHLTTPRAKELLQKYFPEYYPAVPRGTPRRT